MKPKKQQYDNMSKKHIFQEKQKEDELEPQETGWSRSRSTRKLNNDHLHECHRKLLSARCGEQVMTSPLVPS